MIEKAGVCIVKNIDGQLYGLLVQQKGTERWCFPKGTQTNKKESWQKCARRELAEETGLFIHITPDMPYIIFQNTALFIYEASSADIKHFKYLKTKDPKEIINIKWKPLILTQTEIKHKIYHKMVEDIIYHITSKHPTLEPLSIVPRKELISVCRRSKWLPTKFFSQKKQASKSTFWR